jgi:integrase
VGIRKRGKKWLVTVELGEDEQGIRRRKCLTCDTEGEAKRQAAMLGGEVAKGGYVQASTESLSEYLDEWLLHVSREKRQRTRDHYKITVERHLKPALGRTRLCDLRPLHVERFMTTQHKQGLAPATIAKHYWTLHKALDRAVSWGKLATNPADRVEKPALVKAQIRALNVEEQAALLEAARRSTRKKKKDLPDDGTVGWMYGPVLLALATGMRRGEVIALKWSDVDLKAGVVGVRASMEESTAGVDLGETKTDMATRQVRIPDSVVAFLEAHKATQDELRKAVSTYRDRGLVFPCTNGEARRPSTVTRAFARLCDGVKIEGVHFHCLRHTHATELLRAGVPVKVVSERLGHASVSTTLNIYAHVLPDMQDDAAKATDVILGRVMRPKTS